MKRTVSNIWIPKFGVATKKQKKLRKKRYKKTKNQLHKDAYKLGF